MLSTQWLWNRLDLFTINGPTLRHFTHSRRASCTPSPCSSTHVLGILYSCVLCGMKTDASKQTGQTPSLLESKLSTQGFRRKPLWQTYQSCPPTKGQTVCMSQGLVLRIEFPLIHNTGQRFSQIKTVFVCVVLWSGKKESWTPPPLSAEPVWWRRIPASASCSLL